MYMVTTPTSPLTGTSWTNHTALPSNKAAMFVCVISLEGVQLTAPPVCRRSMKKKPSWGKRRVSRCWRRFSCVSRHRRVRTFLRC